MRGEAYRTGAVRQIQREVRLTFLFADYAAKPWEQAWVPNQTGTPNAYRPKGSILAGSTPAPRAADYSAWRPE